MNSFIPLALRLLRNEPLPRAAFALRQHRRTIVDALLWGAEGNDPLPNRFDEPADRFRRRVNDGLELLVKGLDGRSDHAALYVGQRVFELFDPELGREANLAVARASVARERQLIASILDERAGAEVRDAFETAFDSLVSGITSGGGQHVRTLFVGDCLMGEIVGFLVGRTLSDGISIDPFAVHSRDPATLERLLADLPQQTFDAVFVSPFSHARLPELEALLDPRHAFTTAEVQRERVEAILAQTEPLLDRLVDKYECPIFVHNAGLVSRGKDSLRAAAKDALTFWPRALAAARINGWIADYVKRKNAASFRHVHVIDEVALVRAHGRLLGVAFHDSEFQHAVRLSDKLAGEYHVRIAAIAQLLEKKLVVCDLDNTLWSGVIGEGDVEHHASRQRTLKKLRDECGVVLTIASKNDPANVRWDGAVLGAADFVSPQIHWGPKAQSIARLRDSLNLQTRHMVFIDDRPDERALVSEAFPDIRVVDALDPDTWAQLAAWADLAAGSSDVDRTRFYQEREEREAFVASQGGSSIEAVDPAMLKQLGVNIRVTEAAKGDLKRVAELINRTNQWNLCGSRTTFQQVRDWHGSSNAHVFVAHVSDRFGDMGAVCVAVVTTDATSAHIPIFVLSCRVFGYGVEAAMIAHIAKRTEIGSTRKRLVGMYKGTSQNHLAKNMYLDHGFTATDAGFEWRGSGRPAVTT